MSPAARTAAIVVAVLVVAAGGFLLLRDDDSGGGSGAGTGAAPTVTTTTAPGTTAGGGGPTAVADVPVIRLRGGAPVGGVAKITVSKGDTVRFRVSSDGADEVHVHGYDIEKEVAPGRPASFTFPATIEGRFEVESHTTDRQIAEITVEP